MSELVKIKFLKDHRKFSKGDEISISRSFCARLPDGYFEYVGVAVKAKKKTAKKKEVSE